ncbi:MAG: universal stress protein [Rhodospirillales bacterium]|nr:universal stress protein [Rhodospirillales bacterium]MSP80509.1 universal stress protein [Rhodospirillales bacterium]
MGEQGQLSPTGRFEKILLATDASGFGAGAVRVAVAFAKKSGAAIVAMTMVRTNPEYEAYAHDLVERAEEDAWNYLNTVIATATVANVACEPMLRRGEDPAREIVEAEVETHPDLLVTGRRGSRGLARMLVGDATVKAIGQGHCSVLVVPRAAEMWTRRILIGTDGSRYGDAAAVTAGAIARVCALPVTVVGAMVPSHSEARQEDGRRAVERTVQLLQKEGIEAEGVIAPGEADSVIIATAQSRNADLIVLGSYGRTGFGRALVGSVCERVIGQASCSVLAVR